MVDGEGIGTVDTGTVPCPICGHPNTRIVVAPGFPEPGDGDVIQCIDCEGYVMIVPDGVRAATDDEVKAAIVKAKASGFPGW